MFLLEKSLVTFHVRSSCACALQECPSVLGLLVSPCWDLWLESPFPSGDYGLQQSIGSTPRKPPHFLFLPQLLSLCWEHLQAAKTTVVRARREQTGILPSPGSQRVPPGSHLGRDSPRVGIPHPPGREGGRGSATHLPPAFPVAPGNHSNTPCYGFSSGGLGCDRSQALPDSSLPGVLLLPPQFCLFLGCVWTFPFTWLGSPPLLHTRKWDWFCMGSQKGDIFLTWTKLILQCQ